MNASVYGAREIKGIITAVLRVMLGLNSKKHIAMIINRAMNPRIEKKGMQLRSSEIITSDILIGVICNNI
jgi:hypothetical protein